MKLTSKQFTAIKRVLKRHDVKQAFLFGSYARGDANRTSDMDIIIDFRSKKKSLFDLAGVKIDLEETLNHSVDITTPRALHPRLKPTIMAEAKKII